ncbi:MAG: cell division protein FtsA [Cytophagales bacterium]
MDNEQKIVVGLDIGTTKICALVGVKNQYGKLEILGMGQSVSEGVSRGKVLNIEKTVESILKAVELASINANIDIGVVNVGVAGHHIRCSRHHGTIIRQNADSEISFNDVNRLNEDMYRIVVPPGEEIIHVVPQDYLIDGESMVKDPVGFPGVKLEADFHIVTARTAEINNIKKCVKRSNLDSDALILEPIASSMAVLSEEEKEAGVVLVDIGGGTTDVAVFYEGIIRHTAVIPFGGNIISSDIKEGLQVMSAQAEKLKIQFGMALPEHAKENEIVSIPGIRNKEPKEISVKNLAHIIHARIEEIIELVIAEIKASGYSNKLAAGIVITGGGSQLKYLSHLIELMSGMDVRIGFPNEHLGKSKVELVKSPQYATAVGLVLAGFMAIDERENAYRQQSLNSNVAKSVQKPKEKRETFGIGLLKSLPEKLNKFLVDDFDDKKDYR